MLGAPKNSQHDARCDPHTSSSELTREEKRRIEEERIRNKQLENQMSQAKEQDKQIHKLLLLGTGESGKSTLFKQVRYVVMIRAHVQRDCELSSWAKPGKLCLASNPE